MPAAGRLPRAWHTQALACGLASGAPPARCTQALALIAHSLASGAPAACTKVQAQAQAARVLAIGEAAWAALDDGCSPACTLALALVIASGCAAVVPALPGGISGRGSALSGGRSGRGRSHPEWAVTPALRGASTLRPRGLRGAAPAAACHPSDHYCCHYCHYYCHCHHCHHCQAAAAAGFV